MKRYLWKCTKCGTLMFIETELDEKHIHKYPPCPCGFKRMDPVNE